MKICDLKKCISSTLTDKVSKKNRRNMYYFCSEMEQNFDPDTIKYCDLMATEEVDRPKKESYDWGYPCRVVRKVEHEST